MIPKKSLGQNFLTNKNKIRDIVEALELKNGDVILEIGPGHGELTRQIVGNSKFQIPNSKLIAIEKDGKLAGALRKSMRNCGNSVEIITGDVLKILPSLVKSLSFDIENLKLVGNIPYYITGFLLRMIGELKTRPRITVLTVQKEVAERVAAKPPKMNLLAASVQFWAVPEVIGIIPKEDFSPQPKVDSAIIKLVTYNPELKTNAENYYNFIRVLFRQPRKTILNNLKNIGGEKGKTEEVLKEMGIKSDDRPQNLEVSQIKALAEKLSRYPD